MDLKAMVVRAVSVYEHYIWAAAVDKVARLRRCYALLGRTLATATPAPYLRLWGSNRRYHRTWLRCSDLDCLGEVGGRRATPHVPYDQRAPCAMCGDHVVEDTMHFVVDCPRWAAQRQRLWATIVAEVWPPVAAVVAGIVIAGDRQLQLRLILEGDCSHVMPPGYNPTRAADRPRGPYALPPPDAERACAAAHVAVERAAAQYSSTSVVPVPRRHRVSANTDSCA